LTGQAYAYGFESDGRLVAVLACGARAGWAMRLVRALGEVPAREGALDEPRARAVIATATEVMREVVMSGTVGGTSNRPATGGQQVANRALSGL
jgi:hypothetical protein